MWVWDAFLVVNWLHFVSLIYRKQFGVFESCRKVVVNWLHFVSLIYRKQWNPCRDGIPRSCELTTFRIFDISQTVDFVATKIAYMLWIDYISYLWYIANSNSAPIRLTALVVNWLHFVSLIYRKQYHCWKILLYKCCELTTFRIFDISQTVMGYTEVNVAQLWIDYISYLWYIANSTGQWKSPKRVVVNWLHFVSLIYRKQ